LALITYSALPTGPSTGINTANSVPTGQQEAQFFSATVTGQVTSVAFYLAAGSTATTVRFAVYRNSASAPAARVTGDASIAISTLTAGAWNTITNCFAGELNAGSTYWLAFLPLGGTLQYTNNAATGGTVKDSNTAGHTELAQIAPAYAAGTFTNILNIGVMGDDGLGQTSSYSPGRLPVKATKST
jgi:hypothetical protein